MTGPLLVAALLAGASPETNAEDTADPLLITGTSVAIVGALAAWGYGAWWNDGFASFHFKETGFLGQDTYAGGADKVGHLYGCYLSTRATRRLYQALGLRRTPAALISAGAVTLVANGIELVDGFTDYGFEYEDVIFNSLGIGLGLAADLAPEVDALLGMRIGYVPSRDFLRNDKTFIKWINDYTGMLFYLDLKLRGLFELLEVEPGVARYLIVGPVWGTDQYSPVRVHEERRRSLGVHVGLSLAQLLRDGYPGDEGVEAYATFFDYYAVPFLSVSLLSDLNTGEWFLNFGVANRVELGL